jgi:hypothetical protein
VVSTVPLSTSTETGKPRLWDWAFLAVLAISLGAVVWMGQLAYHEGVKTERTKRLGEAWLEWLESAGAERGAGQGGVAACARSPGLTWAACQDWVTGPDGPLRAQVNPFDQQPLRLAQKCDFSDRTLVGALVLEKLMPTPPGSAVPHVIAPLGSGDAIDSALTLRVTVCDKGAGPIKIGEVEF